jgi:myosin heavy subunit
VGYNTSGWIDKNKDPINECIVQLMQSSKEPLVATFFKEPDTDGQGWCIQRSTAGCAFSSNLAVT